MLRDHLKNAKLLHAQNVYALNRPLPKSWTKAAGMFRHKRKALEAHIKKIRLEWDRV